ncbi:hypothetical protein [Pedobacter sp. MW01-1-1]|uniref:hypothetical protein n=1 Tax=Pedobacter sp. MW01-1-1 TaxID=3383027 RepID=UPI003FEFC49D
MEWLTKIEFDILKLSALNNANKAYELDEYNCGSYALDVFNSIRLPDYAIKLDDWIALNGLGFNYGDTPNGLYNKLFLMKSQGYNNSIVGEDFAPEKTGLCP